MFDKLKNLGEMMKKAKLIKEKGPAGASVEALTGLAVGAAIRPHWLPRQDSNLGQAR